MPPISPNVVWASTTGLSAGFIQRIENLTVRPRVQTVRTWFETTRSRGGAHHGGGARLSGQPSADHVAAEHPGDIPLRAARQVVRRPFPTYRRVELSLHPQYSALVGVR